eukprot:scaffold5540_cov96-Cylindrotheca_fusiformis.AAC.11
MESYALEVEVGTAFPPNKLHRICRLLSKNGEGRVSDSSGCALSVLCSMSNKAVDFLDDEDLGFTMEAWARFLSSQNVVKS